MSRGYTGDDKANAEIYTGRFDHYVSKIKEDAIEAYLNDCVEQAHRGDSYKVVKGDDAYVVDYRKINGTLPMPGEDGYTLGQYGPSEAVKDFASNLGSLLSELAWECDRTSANVQAVYNCFMRKDAEAVAALNAIVAELNSAANTWGGTPFQTWDYDTRDLARTVEGDETPQFRRSGRP